MQIATVGGGRRRLQEFGVASGAFSMVHTTPTRPQSDLECQDRGFFAEYEARHSRGESFELVDRTASTATEIK